MKSLKSLFRVIICGVFSNKKILKYKAVTFFPNNYTVTCFTNSNIIKFYQEGKCYYFKECYKPIDKNTLPLIIEMFFLLIRSKRFNFCGSHLFDTIDSNIIDRFDFYIKNLGDNKFLLRRNLCDFYRKFNFWTGDILSIDFSKIGLKEIANELKPIAFLFTRYIQNVVCNDLYRHPLRSSYNTSFASKGIASYELAKSLGLGNLIVPSYFAFLNIGENKLFGMISENAIGTVGGLNDTSNLGDLQMDLVDLSILDSLCYQVDHGCNNYVVNNGRVTAFDNDNPRTFICVPIVGFAKAGDCHLFNNGFGLPFISVKTYYNLFNIKKSELIKTLKPYLTVMQIFALLIRLCLIKSSIKKSEKNGKLIVLNPEQWSFETVLKELKSSCGDTYLKQYIARNKIRLS